MRCNIPSERLEELGISKEHISVGRETIDIILSLKEEHGIIKATEIMEFAKKIQTNEIFFFRGKNICMSFAR
jgi:hypothetical protein